jgi:hypothetical protein
VMFTIESVTDTITANVAAYVREMVFVQEWGLRFRSDEIDAVDGLTLLARTKDGREPIGVLTVVDTTPDVDLHRSLGLSFEEGVRAARYSKLAVLKPYRGLHVPARLMLEARKRVVRPGQFDYTWFLFNSARAHSSCFRKIFGYEVGTRKQKTEYGDCHVLVREEHEPLASSRDQLVAQYLASLDLNSDRALRHVLLPDVATGSESPRKTMTPMFSNERAKAPLHSLNPQSRTYPAVFDRHQELNGVEYA